MAVLLAGAIGWTVYARMNLGEQFTTSNHLRDLVGRCGQIGILLMLVAYTLLQDALPDTNRWVLLVVLVGAYCLGHALWPF